MRSVDALPNGDGESGQTDALPTAKLPPGAMRARAMRHARARRFVIKLLLFIGLPTLAAGLYYGAFASDQYESVSVFTVQAADDPVGGAGMSLLLGALPSSGAARDVLLVKDYILSRDMTDYLVAEHGWLDHVQSSDIDWWSRLSRDADTEEVYQDYLERVMVTHDSQSNTLSLRVRVYSAEMARTIAQAIVDASETMVNQLAERLRADQIKFAQGEVEKAEARYAEARKALIALQGDGAELDPMGSASALLGLRIELEAELAKARAELDRLRASMRADAPKVIEARERVTSLARQVEAQRDRLVDDDTGEGLNRQIARFEPALMEKEFAQHALQSAITSLEMARIEATRQHRYLVTIAAPSEPSAPTHPRRWWGVLSVLVVALLIAGLGSVLIAAVREHAKL